MSLKIKSLIIVLVCMLFSVSMAKNIKIKGAHWFNGDSFVASNIYIVDKVFSFSAPNTIDETIDLNGKYLLPPFGDAHTHNLASDWQIDGIIKRYIAEGTCLYSKFRRVS